MHCTLYELKCERGYLAREYAWDPMKQGFLLQFWSLMCLSSHLTLEATVWSCETLLIIQETFHITVTMDLTRGVLQWYPLNRDVFRKISDYPGLQILQYPSKNCSSKCWFAWNEPWQVESWSSGDNAEVPTLRLWKISYCCSVCTTEKRFMEERVRTPWIVLILTSGW